MPTEELSLLLGGALCLLYTPEREHFGIVPLEAGLYGSPVIACNRSGPSPPRPFVSVEMTSYLALTPFDSFQWWTT